MFLFLKFTIPLIITVRFCIWFVWALIIHMRLFAITQGFIFLELFAMIYLLLLFVSKTIVVAVAALVGAQAVRSIVYATTSKATTTAATTTTRWQAKQSSR